MQRTEKYFEQDAFRTECESVILATEPDEKTGGGRIALDGTVFYPEGGGQPADRGTLTLPDGTTLRHSRSRYLQFYNAEDIMDTQVRPDLGVDW